jgi:hypothetical protein
MFFQGELIINRFGALWAHERMLGCAVCFQVALIQERFQAHHTGELVRYVFVFYEGLWSGEIRGTVTTSERVNGYNVSLSVLGVVKGRITMPAGKIVC